MAALVRIVVLSWADILAVFTMWAMQDYLTKVWELSFTHAAAIMNVWGGLTLIFPLLFLFLVRSFLANYKMLALSSIAYSLGMGFLAMSTPPVLASSTSTCNNYEPKCIGEAQKVLFYIALVFIGGGTCGHLVSFNPFLEEQKNHRDEDEGKIKPVLRMLGMLSTVIMAIVGGIVLPYIKPWSIRFGIPAICTSLATLIFLSFSSSYKKPKPNGSSFTEVGEAKNVAKMVPMWMTFIICGIVSSVGNTYFQEQANNMRPNLGKLKVPVPVFLILSKIAKLVFESLYVCFADEFNRLGCKRYAAPIGIAVAMVFSILCCTTAAKVEFRRLQVIKSHNLYDKAEDKVPMSMFWLIFQYSLLAGVDTFLEKSVEAFVVNQAPKSLADYLGYLTKGVSGLGFIASVLSVFVVGKISEKGGKKSWFQDTLNKSRLDRYYWVLAALSSVNLFVYVFIACSYTYKEQEREQEQEDWIGKAPQTEESIQRT